MPLSGDDAAVRKYAGEVEALKKKIGMPDMEDLMSAELDYQLACAHHDPRKFVAAALEGVAIEGPLAAAGGELMAAVEEAEKASGGPLDGANDKGWEVGAQGGGGGGGRESVRGE